jgi:hypothetical protein
MFFPSFSIILLAPTSLSLALAIVPIIMVTTAVLIPGRSRASISLRYYSIVPVFFVILFSRGFLASQIAVFPYIGDTAGIIIGISLLSWESGLIVTQYSQTAVNARSVLLEHGYETEETEREFNIFRNQILINILISASISLLLYLILFIVPKIRTNVFILIIIFLVVYILLSRIFVRSNHTNSHNNS